MKVTKISDKTQSSLSVSPEQIFEEAIESIGKDGAFKNGKKALFFSEKSKKNVHFYVFMLFLCCFFINFKNED